MRGDDEEEATTDSPDLGSPPVSRFVDVDPVKVDSPSPGSIHAMLDKDIRPEPVIPEGSTSALKQDLSRMPRSSGATRDQTGSAPIVSDKTAASMASAPPPQPLRAGAKRKFGGEENIGFRILKQADKPSEKSSATDKPRLVQDLQKRRSTKDLSAGKRDVKDRGNSLDTPVLNPRKALAAKSANDSPRKVTQPMGTDDSKPGKKASDTGGDKARQTPNYAGDKPISRPQAKKSLPAVQIPPPEPVCPAPIAVATISEPETPIPKPDLMTPNTPEPRLAPPTRDTPPPGLGEASRPSRRARPAISYAEPNLRDKMRRPTKELFDAVAGEGKFKARNSIAAPGTAQKPSEESGSIARAGSSSKGKENARPQEGMSAVEMAVVKEASRRESALSPTPGAQSKNVPHLLDDNKELPSTINAQRRKPGSSMGLSSMDGLVASSTMTGTINFADKPREPSPAGDTANVYDFDSSSPAPAQKTEEPKSVATRSQPRKARASSSFQDNGRGNLTSDTSAGAIYVGRGKRASMAAAMTKLSMLELEDTEESSLEGEAVGKDRASRRKSMML